MQVEKVSEAVKRQPFEPFIIVTSSGSRYLVDHPEMVLVAKGSLYVSQRVQIPQRGELATDPVVISYMHITELVPAPEQAA